MENDPSELVATPSQEVTLPAIVGEEGAIDESLLQDPEVLNERWRVQVQIAASLHEEATKAVNEGKFEDFRRLQSEWELIFATFLTVCTQYSFSLVLGDIFREFTLMKFRFNILNEHVVDSEQSSV